MFHLFEGDLNIASQFLVKDFMQEFGIAH